jgi:hypothetical protein
MLFGWSIQNKRKNYSFVCFNLKRLQRGGEDKDSELNGSKTRISQKFLHQTTTITTYTKNPKRVTKHIPITEEIEQSKQSIHG